MEYLYLPLKLKELSVHPWVSCSNIFYTIRKQLLHFYNCSLTLKDKCENDFNSISVFQSKLMLLNIKMRIVTKQRKIMIHIHFNAITILS